MDLEGMASEILSTVGNFLNTILGWVVNLFSTLFHSFPRTCAPVLALLY